MAQIGTNRLDAGDRFPDITLQFVDRATVSFPEKTTGFYSVLLIYRGMW